ncbi:MAG TPA: DNA polymerase I [bacterium]|nr:DNA polymerase I [bacterium]
MTVPAARDTLLLLDANGLVYRAFYALPYFTTRDGQPTNAVYGFTTMLLKVLDEVAPQYVAVAFDKPGPTFRHEAFAEYKATRQKMPDDLRPQIALAKEVVEAFDLPVFEVAGFEADDVIGTLTRLAEARGTDVVIVTGDLDALQLVSPHTRVMMTSRGISETTVYDEAGVQAKLGVAPARVPDLKSLKGDTTDNIPGVPGVGDKTAARLLAGGATVEEVLEAPPEGRDARLRQRLDEHRAQILQSKALSTIQTDVPLSVSWDLLRRRPVDAARIRDLFTRLEFKSLLDRLGVEVPRTEARGTYGTISPDHVTAFLEGVSEVAIAPVAEGDGPLRSRLVGIALARRGGEASYLELSDGVPPALADVLAREDVPKLSQDVKRDRLLLEGAGLAPRGFAFDVGLASYLLDPGKRTHTLESSAWEHLGWRLHEESADADGLALGPAPGERAAEEADLIFRLRDVMAAQLRAREVDQLYHEIELPLASVLARMERVGVAIDVPALRALSDELRQRLEALTADIYRLAGTEFNIGSPKQLAFVLFEKLQLPALKRTKTGFSTDAEVLEQLAPQHAVVARILEHRELSKLLSTYVDVLPAMVDPRTGRLHTTYNQAVASTGRVITTDPNLQNIPIRTEVGRQIRRAFVAGREGTVLLSADYSQIELRVLAEVTQDPGLLEAFRRGADIHTVTAAEVFSVDAETVTAEMRRRAKAFNYGIAYGISDFGLAAQLSIGRDEARVFMDTYFARYPRVAEYMRTVVEQARRDGYVKTLLGRRRYLPDILSRNRVIREAAERIAINAPIQGTAADIIKIAMLRVDRELLPEAPGMEMILQIHDELLFEVPQELVERVGPRVRQVMEEAYPLAAPLVADLAVGPNWQDLTELT